MSSDVRKLNIIAYTFCIVVALICLIPFLMIISGSFSSEAAITKNGFSLLPQDFSLQAYKTVFKEPIVVFRAYAVTICLTIGGTMIGLLESMQPRQFLPGWHSHPQVRLTLQQVLPPRLPS